MTDDLKKLALAAKAKQTVMKLPPDLYEDRSIREFRRAATPDAILALIRERDEARAMFADAAEQISILRDGALYRDLQALAKSHNEALASLSSAQEEVAKLRGDNEFLAASLNQANERASDLARKLTATITHEPPHG